ncbi:MAG: Ig-like domain-containing protein [Bacilli bacterium]|nr:Ig-like domain-containing protein [Bacilli bacterium]
MKKMKLKKKYKFLLLLLIIFLGVCSYVLIVPKDKDGKLIPLNKIDEKIVITLDRENIYLAKDEEIKVNFSPEDVEWSSSDSSIATVENGVVKGINPGTVTITASKKDVSKNISITVTDLIVLPKIDNKKPYLKCEQYSDEEAKMLDTLLEYRINEAGINTRAGAVAAARFLALEFPYRIHYFYENGRLITTGVRSYVDGEGRYYHKGLYLSKDKYDDILSSQYGPKMWGCSMYSKIVKIKSPNGIDCSGYVSWALLNGGFDVGDGGAGIYNDRDTDMDDLGEKLKITKENLASKRVKVGDLLSMYGHIGILIGMDEEHYYIAESLTNDLHVLTMTEDELLKSDWLQFILLDEVYKEDGNLTNMW